MITVAEKVEEIVRASPFLEEALLEGLLNISALARRIKPQIEADLYKEVSLPSIIMALKRLSEKLEKKAELREAVMKNVKDLVVRANLVEFTFSKEEEVMERYRRLLEETGGGVDYFLTFTQGVFESTLIVSKQLEEKVEEIFSGVRLILKVTDLSAITIKLVEKNIEIPGVYYSILKQLAWYNINVVEVVSTANEFSLILRNSDIDNAFSVLMKLFSPPL